jgi:spore maturation protein CgeB
VRVVILGLSVTSSWGNGHATNYRALVREMVARGHEVLFAERDVPWYRAHRDLPGLPWGELLLYADLAELRARAAGPVAGADLVIVGSYVPEGPAIIEWVQATATGATAFYDIDTPVTLEKLERGDHEYLAPELIPAFDLYLSFTGGPALGRLHDRYGARRPVAFHCFVDPDAYPLSRAPIRWDLGYLGTYSDDRQPGLEHLLLDVARAEPDRRFVVAGPQYPPGIRWPKNVERVEHLAPPDHPAFYAAQRYTLSVTRAQMRRLGWSPSVRLFEAAACGTPIITDPWPGVADVFAPGRDILVASDAQEVRRLLAQPEAGREAVARAARTRVLGAHTAAHRVDQLEAELAALAGATSEAPA